LSETATISFIRGKRMYDLIVIGGGPAGYYAAERAGKAKLSTLLVEKSQIGGVCLNEGCVPSKTMLHSAGLFVSAASSEKFGVRALDVHFDLATVMARKQKIVESLRSGIAFTLKKCNVETCAGPAVIKGKTGNGFKVSVLEKEFEAKRLLVCTGSEAIRLDLPGMKQEFVMTSREILSVSSIPPALAVIGAGAIGLEFAVFFAEAGSRVTVIEMLPQIGGAIDKDISRALQRELEKKGIVFHLQAKVVGAGDHSVTFESGGKTQTLASDIALVSVGRRPVVMGIGLETLGVAVEKGAIATDEKGRTTAGGVWAAGDVNGRSMLAHTAYREAQVCIDDMLGRDSRVNYRAIPSVIYTHPEAACVGLTKEEAIAEGFEAAEAKLPMGYNSRFTAETADGRGIAKAVIDAKTRKLLGVHMAGDHCSEIIFGAAAFIQCGMTVDDVSQFVFPHPTISEMLKDTIGQFE
jgi:dihydrolipoamide dehydrogenase